MTLIDPSTATHADLVHSINLLTSAVQDLRDDIEETRDLVRLWEAVETGGRVVTWLSKIGIAVIGVVLFVKAGAGLLISVTSRGHP